MHSGSRLHTQDNARERGVYTAMVEGKGEARLYVRVGGSDNEWNPEHSSYRGFQEYAAGTGWKVWVGLPGNPEMKIAPLAEAMDVPTFKRPTEFDVPDAVVNDVGP